jgi:hypothetical protein
VTGGGAIVHVVERPTLARRVLVSVSAKTPLLVIVALLLASCGPSDADIPAAAATEQPSTQPIQGSEGSSTMLRTSQSAENAEVVAVDVSGVSGAYTFSVTVRSPDTGCDRYADWWEVVTEDGRLLHSHVDEQPFTRSGGPVEIQSTAVVIVRAHLNTSGYGDVGVVGAAASGFARVTLPIDFAADLELSPPQPPPCGF